MPSRLEARTSGVRADPGVRAEDGAGQVSPKMGAVLFWIKRARTAQVVLALEIVFDSGACSGYPSRANVSPADNAAEHVHIPIAAQRGQP